jgi:hypothetical protein
MTIHAFTILLTELVFLTENTKIMGNISIFLPQIITIINLFTFILQNVHSGESYKHKTKLPSLVNILAEISSSTEF